MYGKSYDGADRADRRQPAARRASRAVVSQEPVYDDYRYLYGDGMRRLNSVLTPALYDGIAATPGPLTDDPNYNVELLNDPACLAPELRPRRPATTTTTRTSGSCGT